MSSERTANLTLEPQTQDPDHKHYTGWLFICSHLTCHTVGTGKIKDPLRHSKATHRRAYQWVWSLITLEEKALSEERKQRLLLNQGHEFWATLLSRPCSVSRAMEQSPTLVAGQLPLPFYKALKSSGPQQDLVTNVLACPSQRTAWSSYHSDSGLSATTVHRQWPSRDRLAENLVITSHQWGNKEEMNQPWDVAALLAVCKPARPKTTQSQFQNNSLASWIQFQCQHMVEQRTSTNLLFLINLGRLAGTHTLVPPALVTLCWPSEALTNTMRRKHSPFS